MRTRQFCVAVASSVMISLTPTAISASAASSPSVDPAFSHIRELASSAIKASSASEDARLLVVAATPPPMPTLYGIPLRGDVLLPSSTMAGIPLRGDISPAQTATAQTVTVQTAAAQTGTASNGIPLRGDLPVVVVTDATESTESTEGTSSVEAFSTADVLEASIAAAASVVETPPSAPTDLPFIDMEFSEAGIPLRGNSNLSIGGVPLRGNLIDQASNTPLTGLALLEAQYVSAKDYERLVLSELANAVGTVTEAGFSTPEVVASWMDASFPRRIAVFTALEYFGAPYSAATTGPDTFDCSGLTLTAWGRAGVDLKHWSVLQQTAVSPVPYELTIPGDLAFFEGGPTAGGVWNIGHVAMVFAPGFMVQSSPSNGVWVDSFEDKREATSFGSPAVDATI
jgi:cell wall-associated NlpC family hydrolase